MSTISKLSSVRVKLLVGQVVRRLVDGEMDYAKIARLAEGGVAEGDVRAAVAALHLIVTGGAKHDVEETILAKELEQLGLPKEHSDAVCRPYGKDKERLRRGRSSTPSFGGQSRLVAMGTLRDRPGDGDYPRDEGEGRRVSGERRRVSGECRRACGCARRGG